jgi:hypothetical protein
MDIFRLPFAFLAFLGFVMVLPAWMYFTGGSVGSLSTEASFIAAMILPATAGLYLASWLQPGG